jgi:pilus assembly protein FimV
MIITCDNCNTRFELEDNLVKEGGSKVRCTNCDNVFVAHPETQSEESDTLDLSDLDMELEMEEVESPDGESQTGENEDIVLGVASEDESDMLDLSDLEKLLEVDHSEEPSDDPDAEEPELELEFEMEEEATGDETIAMDGEAEGLDLTDLEKMLELDEGNLQVDELEEEPEPELELDIEAEAAISGPEEASAGEDELDLSDIEKLLELDDMEAPEPRGDEEELELELDVEQETTEESLELDSETGDSNFAFVGSDDMGLDVEDSDAFALELEEDEAFDVDSGADADEDGIDIDFELEEAESESGIDISIGEAAGTDEEGQTQGFGMGAEAVSASQTTGSTTPAFRTSLPVPKKSMTAAPAILVVLLLLIGGLVGGYYYMDQNGMLPFFRKAGEIMPLEETFNHSFVDNSKIGSLFVITGFVENRHAGSRSNVRVTGELLTDKAKVVQTQTVYCGNIISEMELGGLDINNIKQRLGTASGDKQSNINVTPGAKLPFMVVFSNLPDNMAEYRIQIAGSSPAEK